MEAVVVVDGGRGSMAYRDKTQGFAFVYVDIKKLLASKKPLEMDQPLTEEIKNSKVIRFNKDTAPPAPSPKLPPSDFVPIQPNQVQGPRHMNPIRERAQAIVQIRKNLDRLQSLHHKLHAMLEDLNSVSESRKKKKD